MSQVTADAPVGARTARPDGRSTRWDDHRAERRRELARDARKAVHRLGPEASMDEIASHLGTSKSIVYRYFTDKAGLQHAVGELVLEAIHDALVDAGRIPGPPEQRLHAMVEAYLAMVVGSPRVYAFVTGGFTGAAALPRPGFTAMASRLVAEPLSELLREADADPASADVWAAGVIGFVHGAGEWWITHRAQGAADDVASTASALASHVADWLWTGAVGRVAGRSEDPPDPVKEEP